MPDRKFNSEDPYAESKLAFEYNLREAENRELSGFTEKTPSSDENFESVFGRPRKGGNPLASKQQWHYKDY
jgi:hypothetical protein